MENKIKSELKMNKSERNSRKTANKIEAQRSIIGLYDSAYDNRDLPKYLFGMAIYIIVFVIFIPYLMLHYKVPDEILLAYVPNVDILATVLGYEGGPFSNMWRYLYNPSNISMFGFMSTTIMNYFALLGATFMVAWQTHKHKSWKRGWSAAFIFLLMTYLLPGNLIVILQDKVAKYMNMYFGIGNNEPLLRYVLIVLFGLTLAVSIIYTESIIVRTTRSSIERGIHVAHNAVKYHFNF